MLFLQITLYLEHLICASGSQYPGVIYKLKTSQKSALTKCSVDEA